MGNELKTLGFSQLAEALPKCAERNLVTKDVSKTLKIMLPIAPPCSACALKRDY